MMRDSKALNLRHKALIGLGLAVVALSIPDIAYAQNADDNVLDNVVTTYRDTVGAWTTTLRDYALRLFWGLAFIEFAWTAITLALNGADLQQLISSLVQRILYIGISYWIVLNGAPFAQIIIDSFRQAAGNASGTPINLFPSALLDMGIEIASKIVEETSAFDPFKSIILFLAATICLVAMAIIASYLMLALIEAYVVIAAGIFVLGFLGFRWSSDIAKRFIAYIVSLGMKLFMLQLIIGLGQSLIQGFIDNYSNADMTQNFVIIGVSISFLALVMTVPNLIQGMINGATIGASSALTGATGAVANSIQTAARSLTTATAQFSAVTGAAASLARQQGAFASGGGLSGAVSAGATGAAATARNMGAFLAEAWAERRAGIPGAGGGSGPGQAAQRMRNARDRLAGDTPGTSSGSASRASTSQPYISPLNDPSASKKEGTNAA